MRPRLLVLNQYYWPGVESTGFLLSELCGELARDFDVTVVTGRVRGARSESREVHDGVKIVRVRSTTFDRANIWLRALNYLTFLADSLLTAIRIDRPDVVMCMTDPPVIGNVATLVARRFRAPLVVVSQDVFPEIAVALGRVTNPLVVAVLRRAIGLYLRRADRVVAIGETMRERLAEKGAPRERLRVISNWVDTAALAPQPRPNPWLREHGFEGRFLVMHSGNIGHAQDLDALLGAATLLRDLDDVAIVLIGGGARREELVELATALGVDDLVTFLPYQDRDALSQSLSSASVHVVGLASGLAGYVVPSRLYGILAVGRPVIAAADSESETAQLVASVGCGLVVPPGDPAALADAVRAAHKDADRLEAMGATGRNWVVANADRAVAVERYRALLREVVGVPS